MSALQHQRIHDLCQELRLTAIPDLYSGIAQAAAAKQASLTDFLEEMLRGERDARRARGREMFARVAGFPAIKTLDSFDFGFATGVPRKQIHELASGAFIERAETASPGSRARSPDGSCRHPTARERRCSTRLRLLRPAKWRCRGGAFEWDTVSTVALSTPVES